VRCPLCETENPGDAAECANCGKQLHTDAELLEDVSPIEGLEETLRDPAESATGHIDTLADLQQTQLASRDLRIQDELVPGVERTQLTADESAPSNWTVGNVDLDMGRERDLEPRTARPQDTGTCPWCGAAAAGAVCDACGRRRSRYTTAPAAAVAATSEETVLCPACFSRVPAGARCGECGVPFGPREN
jgi:hypothetical protein